MKRGMADLLRNFDLDRDGRFSPEELQRYQAFLNEMSTGNIGGPDFSGIHGKTILTTDALSKAFLSPVRMAVTESHDPSKPSPGLER